jgi:Galactose oxidase, central domain
MKLHFFILMLGVSLFSTACGGGSSSKTVSPTMYTIGGTVSGLAGTGLVLQNDSGDSVTVSAKATAFTFPTSVTSGSSYKVSVMTQPSNPTQSCLVTSASGMTMGDVTTVSVACSTTKFTVGGLISGLVGTGLVLQNDSGDSVTVSAKATAFTFPTSVTSGSSYKVSVMTQPSNPTQSCVVNSASGMAMGDVTTVSVSCTTTTFTVGGSISGLVGTGLVLQNNSGDNLTVVPTASTFTFPTVVDSVSGYKVSVLTQPSTPMQNCVVSNASGPTNGDVTTVGVACTMITYKVGGTILGLIGSNLVLQNNSGDNLPVASNATGFTFVTKLDGGASYKVAVLSQPSNPTQSCSVTGGNGASSVDVTTVVVTCSNINEWTWVGGPQGEDQIGTYGTKGTGDSNNVPGARYWGVSWADASGNFWHFGGYGYDSLGTVADLNDLWEGSYNSTGQWTWTWMGGSEVAGVGGTYGALGTADPANMPGARDSAVSWTDASGNFWLFGGHGYDSVRTADNLNDLWKFSGGEWTWVSGSNVVNQQGIYGSLGTGDPSNVPGARYSAVSWTDKTGNFWLFGGLGYDSTGTSGSLNDLWEGSYNSAGQWIWTWVAGSNVAGAITSTVPGARYLSASWTDKQGNLWLFGGYGPDVAGDIASLSDLWEYSVSSGQWKFVGGSETAATNGLYGTLGTGSSGNAPGSRKGAVAWTDSDGNFWLFGGIGVDSNKDESGELNDLWEYNPTTAEWTWQSGSDLINGVGVYGTLGSPDPTNVPGARGGSPNWIDAAGNLWLFGGNGPISGANGSFSDLWKYVP